MTHGSSIKNKKFILSVCITDGKKPCGALWRFRYPETFTSVSETSDKIDEFEGYLAEMHVTGYVELEVVSPMESDSE